MSSRLPLRPVGWLRAKHVVFALIAGMSAYPLYYNERFLVEPTNPDNTSIERPTLAAQEVLVWRL